MIGADLLYRVENHPIDLLRVRDDDIPTLVGGGVADLGVVGGNVLEEHEFANDARHRRLRQAEFACRPRKTSAFRGAHEDRQFLQPVAHSCSK